MAKTFTAQLEDAATMIESEMRYVAIEAIQDVMEAAMTPQLAVTKGAPSFEVGKIPVADAELINSLTSNGTKGRESYVTALSGYVLGQYMTFAWTAPHAMRIEQGFNGTDEAGRTFRQEGRHFVGANARKFAEFVEKRAAEVR